jgi:hypothetical protein
MLDCRKRGFWTGIGTGHLSFAPDKAFALRDDYLMDPGLGLLEHAIGFVAGA